MIIRFTEQPDGTLLGTDVVESIGNERDVDDVAEAYILGRPTEDQVRRVRELPCEVTKRIVTREDGSMYIVDVDSRTIEEHPPPDLDDTHVLLGKLALLVSKWRRLGDMRSDCAQELDELIEKHVDAL